MTAESSVRMTDLIGRPQSHSSIARFLKDLGAGVGMSEKQAFPTLKSRPACQYHNYKLLGISLCFEDETLQAFHLYNQGHGYSAYKGELPFNIGMGMSAKDIVETLGEPDGKIGGGRAGPISISYKDKGLHFNLASSDWEDRGNCIESLTLHKPQTVSSDLQLGGCD